MKSKGSKGSTILEFVLAGSFIFVPLLVGTATVGMSMFRAMQVIALNRDVAHMFATGIDFSQQPNLTLLQKVAGSLNFANGVIILSEIDGTANNQAVCSRRIVIGNALLAPHAFAYVNPAAGTLDAGGNVVVPNDPSLNVDPSFAVIMPMTNGQVVYLTQTYFSSSDYDWTGLLSNTGINVKAVF